MKHKIGKYIVLYLFVRVVRGHVKVLIGPVYPGLFLIGLLMIGSSKSLIKKPGLQLVDLIKSGDSCQKEGHKIASPDNCKNYIICQNGKYVNQSCGFWQDFDFKTDECRWSPMVTCRPKLLTNLQCVANSDICTKNEHKAVLNQCQYFCSCNEGHWRAEMCDMDKYYDVKTETCVADSTVCLKTPTYPGPNYPWTFFCSKVGRMQPYPADCRYYYKCTETKDGSLFLQQAMCGSKEYFDGAECKYNIAWHWSWPFIQYPCSY